MNDPKQYHFDLPDGGAPDDAPLAERWFPNVKKAALKVSKSRGVDPIEGVTTIVVHATAGSSSAGAASVIFDRRASFHWLVPDEDEPQHGHFVWATCHEARAAFHVRKDKSHPRIAGGKRDVNRFSLGIEIVNAQRSSDHFSDWQVEATAGIVRYAWAKYPNLEHVCSHAMLDPERRSDPGTHFPWNDFRDLVLRAKPAAVDPLVAQATHLPVGGATASCCIDETGAAVALG